MDIFRFSPEKGVTYLNWMVHTFNPDEMRKASDDSNEMYIRELCIEILSGLFYDNKVSCYNENLEENIEVGKCLYEFLKTNDFIDKMFFEKPIWEKHDLVALHSYMDFFISHGDFNKAIKGYDLYLVAQSGQYNNNDLYHFWDSSLTLFFECSSFCPPTYYDFVVAAVEKLGKYSGILKKRAKHYLIDDLKDDD